jgi:hypothetical protein
MMMVCSGFCVMQSAKIMYSKYLSLFNLKHNEMIFAIKIWQICPSPDPNQRSADPNQPPQQDRLVGQNPHVNKRFPDDLPHVPQHFNPFPSLIESSSLRSRERLHGLCLHSELLLLPSNACRLPLRSKLLIIHSKLLLLHSNVYHLP